MNPSSKPRTSKVSMARGAAQPKKVAPKADPCGPHSHAKDSPLVVSDGAFERAASLFRAAGDLARLRLLHQLDTGEHCVSELALASETKLSTLSQQLRVLHQERIVKRRRDGKHVFYSLADGHVRELIRAALQHADEPQR